MGLPAVRIMEYAVALQDVAMLETRVKPSTASQVAAKPAKIVMHSLVAPMLLLLNVVLGLTFAAPPARLVGGILQEMLRAMDKMGRVIPSQVLQRPLQETQSSQALA